MSSRVLSDVTFTIKTDSKDVTVSLAKEEGAHSSPTKSETTPFVRDDDGRSGNARQSSVGRE